MSGPRTPSRNPSLTSISTTESQNAALLGAAKAFGRAPVKPEGPEKTSVRANGALAAATKVGAGLSPTPKHACGSSSQGKAAEASPSLGTRQNARWVGEGPVGMGREGTGKLGVPKQADIRSRSPSAHAAARLAVARSPEPSAPPIIARPRSRTTQKPSVAPKPRRLSDRFTQALVVKTEGPTDASPIAPTTSLVELFERKSSTSNSPDQERRPTPVTAAPSRDLPLKSPKPTRTPDGGITSVFQMELGEANIGSKPLEAVQSPDQAVDLRHAQGSSSEEYVSASEDTALPSSPITIRKRDSRARSVSSVDTFSTMSPINGRLRPASSPARHATTHPIRIEHPAPRDVALPPSMTSLSSQSSSIPAQYNLLHPRRMTPLSTGDALANAIVASSLASSRAPSPHKLEPPPVPTRRQHHGLSMSRSASPPKQRTGMRQTLRKAETDDSGASGADELHPYGKHKKKRLVRKHPNKHHEGDRKRWRDAVTERERKRYEGVWAANKGILCTLTSEEETKLSLSRTDSAQQRLDVTQTQICNIIVRDIWTRSRLPETVLEDVWDLVDNDAVGRLTREEFVVGMWLIDQRLKGRKLPVKVTESVWASVRGLQGIKIRKMN